MASHSDLGNAVQTFSNPRLKRTLVWLGAGIGLIVAAVLSGTLLGREHDLYSITVIAGLIGGFLLLIGLFTLPGMLISLARNVTVTAYENGIEHRVGTRVTRLLWSEIQTVERQESSSDLGMGGVAAGAASKAIKETRYALMLKNGEKLVLSSANLKKIDELGRHIETKIQRQPA